ncbi:MAG TPA: MopE-related protein, partial [Flavisolibacter sp.]
MKRLFIALLLVLAVLTARAQHITAAEYFLDADPGPGNGTPTTVGVTGVVVNFAANIPANLSPGFHWLGVRTRDADGHWGFFQRRNFFVQATGANMPVITAAEYFFDNDPGPGNGTPLAINTPGQVANQNFMVPVPSNLPAGTHILAIRVKDQAGHWGLFARYSLTSGGSAATISCPADTTAAATTWECLAVVNGIDPLVSPTGSSYTYSLTGATTNSGTGSASGKVFNTGITTVTYALSSAPATSCSFNVTVSPNMTPAVSIYTPYTWLCSGTAVYFQAFPVHGGLTPTYQWKKNGINVGTNSNLYLDSTLANGDTITVEMTSSIACISQAAVTSNAIVMSVTQTVTPSVSITASATTICTGQQVTFTATPVNGGTPSYQWRRNNQAVGTDSPVYQTSSLANGDSISVLMTTTVPCYSTSNISESNFITMTVSQALTPSVSITASQTTICPGQQVTFTATPVNGGNNPVYEWTVNNNAVGSNSPVFQSSSLVNGDVVRVAMSPSNTCGNPTPVYSNQVTISTGAQVTPAVSITASAQNICAGTAVTFTATPVNGGSAYYEWKLNGVEVGTNSNTYQTSALTNGDAVTCVMTSSLSCASPASVTSNPIMVAVSPSSTFYRDLDGDGYGKLSSGTVQACTAPQGYVSNDTDCDDNNAAVNPGTTETCGNATDDNCNGALDESCPTGLLVLETRTYPLKEGHGGTSAYQVEVRLDAPATAAVMVHYTMVGLDATPGTDYIAGSGWLHIPAGATSGFIPVQIVGDVVKESNERFLLYFTNPVNAALGNGSFSRVIIIDDDKKAKNGFAADAEARLTIPSVARR